MERVPIGAAVHPCASTHACSSPACPFLNQPALPSAASLTIPSLCASHVFQAAELETAQRTLEQLVDRMFASPAWQAAPRVAEIGDALRGLETQAAEVRGSRGGSQHSSVCRCTRFGRLPGCHLACLPVHGAGVAAWQQRDTSLALLLPQARRGVTSYGRGAQLLTGAAKQLEGALQVGFGAGTRPPQHACTCSRRACSAASVVLPAVAPACSACARLCLPTPGLLHVPSPSLGAVPADHPGHEHGWDGQGHGVRRCAAAAGLVCMHARTHATWRAPARAAELPDVPAALNRPRCQQPAVSRSHPTPTCPFRVQPGRACQDACSLAG